MDSGYRDYQLKARSRVSAVLEDSYPVRFAIFVLFCGYSRLTLARLGFSPGLFCTAACEKLNFLSTWL